MEVRKTSILQQVMVLFAVAVILIGVFTYISLYLISEHSEKEHTEDRANQLSAEIALAIREYPSHKWLITYWHEHADELDIEYDAEFQSGTETDRKYSLLLSHQPMLRVQYATEEEVAKLPAEDQKLFAEIVYSWIITRLDELKVCYGMDYLFIVMTDDTFSEQFFLLSAADIDSVRGTDYEEVYPLGVKVKVSDDQKAAMQDAAEFDRHLAAAGNYVDYYALLTQIDNYYVFIGLTFNMEGLNADVAVQTRNGTSFITFMELLLSLICLMMTASYVIKPLKTVQNNIRTYKVTKDSSTIINDPELMKNRNEIGELANDFKDLALEMDEYIDRIEMITAERERIGTELETARQIQASMMPNIFPPFPDRHEFDVYASMEPAKEVGGDFYDFFLIDEDHLGLVIADVSGKGIPAALLMMATKIILQSYARLGYCAADILDKVNEAVCSNNKEEMFITVWVGILEISTGKLTAANAGHEYPVIRRAGGDFELYKDRHGLVIGGMEGSKYYEYELQLKPDDKLFVFTDGVNEATNSGNELLGTDRMIKALNNDPAASPEQILGNVHKAIDDFVQDAEQFDDITMMCREYRGSKE